MLLRDKPWDKNLQLMLIGIFALNLVTHIPLVPLWITACALLCIGWKLLYLTRGFQLPKKWVTSIFATLSAVGVFGSFSTLLGQEAAGALLVIATALKLLETNRYRDAMLVVFTCYFLLMTYLLDTQSLLATGFMLIDAALITVLMAQIHRRERRAPMAIRPTLRMLALSLPIWAVLFFVFPRFSSNLGYNKPNQGQSGFSDDLDPGSISKLIESEEVAFRVEFQAVGGAHVGVSPDALYWRGAVLNHGNGLKWIRTSDSLQPDAYEQSPQASFVRTTIWLEPGFQRWLFALDIPIALASGDATLLHLVRRQPGFIYEYNNAANARTSYSVRSLLSPPAQILSSAEREVYLQLPEELDPRLGELATRLRTEASANRKVTRNVGISNQVLEWFAKTGFRYSKSPGALRASSGPAQLAEFIFTRKVGFCEHYASSFATLMRLAGVPARVVVGFQGATHNQVGDYWVVRKMDAHAWTEIWSDEPNGRGRWLRVDPTESVAPLRIQFGGQYNSLDENSIAGLSGDELRRQLHQGVDGGLKQLRLAFDVLQMKWNAFLLSYDLEYQLQLLASIGLDKSGLLILGAFTLAAILLFSMLVVWLSRRNAQKPDPLVNDWRKFCAILAKSGLERRTNEGPLAFADRARLRFPESSPEITQIALLFAELRYGQSDKTDQRKLRRLIRGFAPKSLST